MSQRGSRPDHRNDRFNRPHPRHIQGRGPPHRGPHQSQDRPYHDPNGEIPPQHRRTLILSNIPPTLSFQEIRKHFTLRGMHCDFCSVDRNASEAYVKFRERGDVLKLWEGGDELLDGDTGSNGGGLSLVKAGVKIKAIHFTNAISLKDRGGDKQLDDLNPVQFDRGNQPQFNKSAQQFDRKRSRDGNNDWRDRDFGSAGREPNGGRGSFMQDRGRSDPNKTPRGTYHSTPGSQSAYNSQQGSADAHHSSAPSHISGSNNSEKSGPNSDPVSSQSSNSYEKCPSKPVQIHSQNSPVQTSWRRNPQAVPLSVQISTMEQKFKLSQMQESTLQKQLGLQKKMLAVLKAKNDDMSKHDQSKKLKEILTTQTKITELKKERMESLKELEGLKTKQKAGIEKKKAMAAKKKLDMRTTALKVEGLCCEINESLQESIKDHFSAFGTVTHVSITCDEADNSSVPFAVVTFSSRADAEKAKTSEAKFNEMTLMCTWHKPFAASPDDTETGDDTNANEEGENNAIDSYNDIYDDVYEEELVQSAGVQYDEDEEHMVDYD